MISLSKVLKETIVTKSQKWAEIEKSKFLLYNFCLEQVTSFLSKNKTHLSPKDIKEVQYVITKAREGLCSGFLNLGQLFYSKEDQEVQSKCKQVMFNITEKLDEKDKQLEKADELLRQQEILSVGTVKSVKLQLEENNLVI